jgi:hypothetical protein
VWRRPRYLCIKQGINSGTLEAANEVTIIQAQGSGYSTSSLVAGLAENE